MVPELFQKCSNGSRTVLELTLVCSRTDLEQILEFFWNNCRTPIKMSHFMFYEYLGIVLEHL